MTARGKSQRCIAVAGLGKPPFYPAQAGRNPAERAASFAESVFSEVDTQEFLSEHIIAPPTVWRERVSAAGQWLAHR